MKKRTKKVTKTIRIWLGRDRNKMLKVQGVYFEFYQPLPVNVNYHKFGWTEFRVGGVVNKEQNTILVYRQLVKSRDDIRPDNICAWKDQNGEHEAWSYGETTSLVTLVSRELTDWDEVYFLRSTK